MAYDALGYAKDHPDLVTAKSAIKKLLVLKDDEGYCQPCLSPIWDTALAVQAMMEAGEPRDGAIARRAAEWMVERQILTRQGRLGRWRPHVRPGGWAFQYWNDHYPDVDDTAVVGIALDRVGDPRHREAIDRAAEWVIGMQWPNGGWGAFDADNTYYYLNHIPFADHGALLDPPTADVSARCIGFLCQIGYERDHPAVARGLDYLRRTQQEDGSWFGRWGTNYIYGTWSVLAAFNAAGEDAQAPHIRRAVDWLKSRQRPDGGWGEDGASYWNEQRDACKASTASQTAWAVLGLMAAGEVDSDAVRRGIAFLTEGRRQGARWDEEWYTAVGFPRVFYLRYHGYAAYFPLWALARYRGADAAATPRRRLRHVGMSAPTADMPDGAALHRIGIVVGLVREAETLAPALRALSRGRRPLLFCSGGSVERAAFGVERMLEDGVAGLLSFGMAGGLDPALGPGDLLVAERVVAPDGASYAATPPGPRLWSRRRAKCPAARMPARGAGGVDRPSSRRPTSGGSGERTGAVAVDMESHVVAEAAAGAACRSSRCGRSPIRPSGRSRRRRWPAWRPTAARDRSRSWRTWC